MAHQAPSVARDAVLMESSPLPEDMPQIKGYDFNQGLDHKALLQSFLTTGFQASSFGQAVLEINKMVSVRLTGSNRKTSFLLLLLFRDALCVCGWSRSRGDWSRCRRSSRAATVISLVQDAPSSWATHQTWSAPVWERAFATWHSTGWYDHPWLWMSTVMLFAVFQVLWNEFDVVVGRCDSDHSWRDWRRLHQMFSTYLPRRVQSKRQRASTARH